MKITRKFVAVGAAGLATVALTVGAVSAASSNSTTPSAISPQAAALAVTAPTPSTSVVKEKAKATKTVRAKYKVGIKRTKGVKIKSVEAWVGDRADGGVKAKVRNIKDTKKAWRWQVVVPMTAADVAAKGLTVSYLMQMADGTQEWRDKGVTLGVR
jgi:hypothetical protein